MLRHAAAVAFLLTALGARPLYADVTGRATVIDGDTAVVIGERVLQGINAPELRYEWACWRSWLRAEGAAARPAGRVHR